MRLGEYVLMTAPAPGSQITWDWMVLEREGTRGGWIVAHHVAAELCGSHCGKVGGTRVVFAAADDGHAAQLTLNECQKFVVWLCGIDVPLWKLSSMGGIIL